MKCNGFFSWKKRMDMSIISPHVRYGVIFFIIIQHLFAFLHVFLYNLKLLLACFWPCSTQWWNSCIASAVWHTWPQRLVFDSTRFLRVLLSKWKTFSFALIWIVYLRSSFVSTLFISAFHTDLDFKSKLFCSF
jgi:hypothetical protein